MTTVFFHRSSGFSHLFLLAPVDSFLSCRFFAASQRASVEQTRSNKPAYLRPDVTGRTHIDLSAVRWDMCRIASRAHPLLRRNQDISDLGATWDITPGTYLLYKSIIQYLCGVYIIASLRHTVRCREQIYCHRGPPPASRILHSTLALILPISVNYPFYWCIANSCGIGIYIINNLMIARIDCVPRFQLAVSSAGGICEL